MRSSRFISLVAAYSMIAANLMGCQGAAWRKVQVGQTTGAQIGNIFGTAVAATDRYAYALSVDELTGNKTLIMVSMDDNGVARSKYYWHIEPAPMFGLLGKSSWKMLLETRIAPSQLQEFSLVPGPREEAIVGYFGSSLFDTARHFEHLDGVSGITRSMGQILNIAIDRYDTRTDKQTMLTKKKLTFDGQKYGKKCSMALKVVDDSKGIYSLAMKGRIGN